MQFTSHSLRQLAAAWHGPLIVAAAFCSLLAWTWRKWPHVLVDFGRELYVPWRLSDGAVLYRDIAYNNGPLSPYFNAALFRVFGVSLTTLVVANAVLLALLLSLIYRWVARSMDRTAAIMSCLIMLSVFAFAQIEFPGNYNFICPYSHEMTHGVILSFLMLALLSGNLQQQQRIRLVAAGICWGLIFLGKVEIFVAVTVAGAVLLTLPLLARTVPRKEWLLGSLTFLAAGLLPVGWFVLLLSRHMPAGEALVSVTGAWRWMFSSDLLSHYFYRQTLGIDRPIANAVAFAKGIARVLLVITACVLYDLWRRGCRFPLLVAAAAILCVAATFLLRSNMFPYLVEARFAVFASLGMIVIFTAAILRRRRDPAALERFVPLVAWAVFGLLMLTKMLLYPRISHYGFVLILPSTVLAVAFMVHFLPRVCRLWYGGGTFRKLVVCLLMFDVVTYTFISSAFLTNKSYQVAAGGDRILTEVPESTMIGPGVAKLLREVEATMPADATFVALPEGVMLNYLSRRENPTRFINFMPPELIMYGEQNIIDELDQKRPDFVLIVHKETPEYGVRFFGTDNFGVSLMNWVRRRYRPVKTILNEPLHNSEFGIKILRRIDAEGMAARRLAATRE